MKKVNISVELIRSAKKIELLLMDCDGVLTDGRLYYSAEGEALKTFHVHDGQGIKLWHRAGFRSGIITGRESKMLEVRSQELGIDFLCQSSKNKMLDLNRIADDCGLGLGQIAYVGDDLSDSDVLSAVGLPVLVANAAIKLERSDALETNKCGGFGAIREVVDLLLELKSK
ncbi:MAG: hypothetical protein R2681_06835 [Pyrinomonadaceae bacterium]